VSDDNLGRENPLKRSANSRAAQICRIEFVVWLRSLVAVMIARYPAWNSGEARTPAHRAVQATGDLRVVIRSACW
jgi:hypothetical protein